MQWISFTCGAKKWTQVFKNIQPGYLYVYFLCVCCIALLLNLSLFFTVLHLLCSLKNIPIPKRSFVLRYMLLSNLTLTMVKTSDIMNINLKLILVLLEPFKFNCTKIACTSIFNDWELIRMCCLLHLHVWHISGALKNI